MSTIKGMNVLRSTPREAVFGAPVPLRDDVEIELGTKYGRLVVPFFYVVRDDEVVHLVEWMQRTKVWSIDTETGGPNPMDGLDPLVGKVATLQIGNPKCADPRVYVLDVRCLSTEALAPVFALLADPAYYKLGQNVRFEYKFLRTNFGVMCRNLGDTQLTEQVLRAGLFRGKGGGPSSDDDGRNKAAYKYTSMDALCKFYLGIQIDKDRQLRTSFYSTPPGQHTDRQRCYAGGDVVYPFYVAAEQREVLDERQLRDIAKLEHSIIPSFGEAELRGMYLDQDEWRALWQESLAKLLEARTKLDALFLGVQGDLFDGRETGVRPIYIKSRKSPPLNWGSSEQVKWAIAQYCKTIGWSHEIITTYERLLQVKAVCGESWRAKKAAAGHEVTVEDTPDWVVPEEQYCILLSAERDRLIIAACRNQLPWALVDPLADYSKYAKRVGTYGIKFLEKNVRKDTKRFHPEIHQAITVTGRISTKPNCYDGATEILTTAGWVRFDALSDAAAVAQVDPETLKVSFVQPSRVVRVAYDGPMLHFTTDQEQIDLVVTPNHRMLVENRSGVRRTLPASELARLSCDHVKHFNAGMFGGGTSDLTPDQVRLLVAVQADGNITDSGALDFSLAKHRKRERLRELFRKTNIVWKERPRKAPQSARHSPRMRFTVGAAQAAWIVDTLTPAKQFGPWVLNLSRAALDAFVEEVWLWDGCHKAKTMYCAKARINADYVQAAHALSGRRIRVAPRTNNADRKYWLAYAARRGYSMLDNRSVIEDVVSGMVYCVTVPTGAVLVRHQTKSGAWVTSVSGNSQNLPSDKRYRACIKAAPGKKLVLADYSQIEPRITALVSRDTVYCETYRKGDDLYLADAEHTLGYRPNKHEEDGKFQRQLSKVRVLSLAYNMGVMKYRDRLTIALVKEIRAGKVESPSVEFARQQYDSFFDVHPEIETWQDEMVQLADPKKSERKIWDAFLEALVTWIEAPCGRKRFFPPDANPYSEAPNFPPQGCGASILKYAIRLMQQALDARGWAERAYLVNTVHDEPIYEADEEIAAEVAVLLRDCMEQAGNAYNGDIPVIAEWPENSNGTVDYWTKALELDEADDLGALDKDTEAAQDILDATFAEAA